MNSTNRASSLRNSPTQYSRLIGSSHGNRNNHHLNSNPNRPTLHNRRVTDWVNHVQYGKDYLHQFRFVNEICFVRIKLFLILKILKAYIIKPICLKKL